jgi:pimeloyl-ACP methyl ester carboxylesterase
MPSIVVANGPIDLHVVVQDTGPLILCVHGYPELSYSWRHQIDHFSTRGYTVAALDVRGYGQSSKPTEVSAYSMRELTSDVAAVIDALGGRAILVGHDWGAPIVWNTAVLYPDKVAAVAGLSVPYYPLRAVSFIERMREVYRGKYFYQLYYQTEDAAEAEMETDLARGLRMTYYSWSGDAPLMSELVKDKGPESSYLEGYVDPETLPAWLSEADLQVYVDAFSKGGVRAPLHRYRAHAIDAAEIGSQPVRLVLQPACFVAAPGMRCATSCPVWTSTRTQGSSARTSGARRSSTVRQARHWKGPGCRG